MDETKGTGRDSVSPLFAFGKADLITNSLILGLFSPVSWSGHWKKFQPVTNMTSKYPFSYSREKGMKEQNKPTFHPRSIPFLETDLVKSLLDVNGCDVARTQSDCVLQSGGFLHPWATQGFMVHVYNLQFLQASST